MRTEKERGRKTNSFPLEKVHIEFHPTLHACVRTRSIFSACRDKSSWLVFDPNDWHIHRCWTNENALLFSLRRLRLSIMNCWLICRHSTANILEIHHHPLFLKILSSFGFIEDERRELSNRKISSIQSLFFWQKPVIIVRIYSDNNRSLRRKRRAE